MKIALQILFIFFATINMVLAYVALFKLHQPTTVPFWAMKVMTSGLAPFLFLLGLLIAISGQLLSSRLVITMGSCSALLFLIHIFLVSSKPNKSTDFESAFGPRWEKNIPEEMKDHFLSQRYVIWLPKPEEPIFTQDISFYTIPETNRNILCDIWQPPKNRKRTGVAFIYLHGSAWTSLDKDFGTRPFFKHLANQGHVVMDVAYRLFSEAGMMDMVYDAKHAIAWMKQHADVYGIDPDRIVIGGGSAGAHIALLAAYTDHDERFIPPDLKSADLSIHGVVSLYGQSDLVSTYFHTKQDLTKHSALGQQKNGKRRGMPSWMKKSMGKDFHRLGLDKNVEPGMLSPMFGGSPEENPEPYLLFSPITHINSVCPSTLILHGEQDILAPVEAIRRLYTQLKKSGVPVVMHLIPQTDHAFDLIFPKFSPSAQNAIYDVERFLAVMAKNNIKQVKVFRLEQPEYVSFKPAH